MAVQLLSVNYVLDNISKFQILVIKMWETVEACPSGPPPCLGAVCSCAGGGLTRAGVSLIHECIPFIEVSIYEYTQYGL